MIHNKPYYKLGTQVDVYDSDVFEYSLCFMSSSGKVISYIPLGSFHPSDDIPRKARELLELLNKDIL